jgi:hydroxyacylglutathione hydrolase
MLIKIFVLTPFQQNTRIVSCETTRKAICIDPGEPSPEVVRYIRDNDLELQAIILTHGHLDHIGGTAALKGEFPDAEVLLHKEEMYLYDMLQQQPLFMGIQPHQMREMGLEYEPAPRPTRFLEHGEVYEVGTLKFSVRHCPGHTLGHIVLAEENERAVFTGDCLFSGAIGRTDLPGGDHEQLLGSIREQVLSLDDDFVVHCGHGPETTVGREKSTNPFFTGAYQISKRA